MRRAVGLAICLLLSFGCAQKKEDLNTVTIWHWMTDRQKAFEELAALYEQQTGVKVKIDLYAPSDAYSQRIVASAQSRVLPDIYGILDKKEIFASFIQSGFVADLTAEFQKENNAWEKMLFPKALDVNRFPEGNIYGVKPGIYGVPLDVTIDSCRRHVGEQLLQPPQLGLGDPRRRQATSQPLQLRPHQDGVGQFPRIWLADARSVVGPGLHDSNGRQITQRLADRRLTGQPWAGRDVGRPARNRRNLAPN